MFYVRTDLNTSNKFDMINFLNFDVDNIDCHGSYMLENIRTLSQVGIMKITAEQYRPDMLSYNLYGITDYWWILMWYNSIVNISDLVSGVEIRYPSQVDIENLYINCSTAGKVN